MSTISSARCAASPRAARPWTRKSCPGSCAHAHELRPLTAREREVLQLVAEGRSNRAIAERLAVTERAVQKHVTSIFLKLELPDSADDNRRILAVLAYLQPDLARASAAR